METLKVTRYQVPSTTPTAPYIKRKVNQSKPATEHVFNFHLYDGDFHITMFHPELS